MMNKTLVKEKRTFLSFVKSRTFLIILFSAFSLGVGFLVAYFGKGVSYIEKELITAIITLFGFGLTATVFVYQAFEQSQIEGTVKVIKALSKTLLLTLCLIMASLSLDFVASLGLSQILNTIFNSLKYATLVYSMICQFDILNSFIVIITFKKKP